MRCIRDFELISVELKGPQKRIDVEGGMEGKGNISGFENKNSERIMRLRTERLIAALNLTV